VPIERSVGLPVAEFGGYLERVAGRAESGALVSTAPAVRGAIKVLIRQMGFACKGRDFRNRRHKVTLSINLTETLPLKM
jgi:hypothetical protein